jgi:hypothetical protein
MEVRVPLNKGFSALAFALLVVLVTVVVAMAVEEITSAVVAEGV